MMVFTILGLHQGVQFAEGADYAPLGDAGTVARAADPATPT